jgi:hypothetical protein
MGCVAAFALRVPMARSCGTMGGIARRGAARSTGVAMNPMIGRGEAHVQRQDRRTFLIRVMHPQLLNPAVTPGNMRWYLPGESA